MTRDQELQTVHAAAAEFPATFGLKAFPGRVFRISTAASYCTIGGDVQLYTQALSDDGWLDFAKASPAELRKQIKHSV